jgi:hypothetical protein
MRCQPDTRRSVRSDAVSRTCSEIAAPESRASCSHAAAVAGLLVVRAHAIAGSTLVVPNQCTVSGGHCPPERARSRPACGALALGVAHRGHRRHHSAPAKRTRVPVLRLQYWNAATRADDLELQRPRAPTVSTTHSTDVHLSQTHTFSNVDTADTLSLQPFHSAVEQGVTSLRLQSLRNRGVLQQKK